MSLSAPSLPAAQTKTMPWPPALEMAFESSLSEDVFPHELLAATTFTPLCFCRMM